uniref:Transmembrane protein 234 homolog isoform X2 n=1 Tax=Elaeis guineensis var. tenera TaxID=51953 RepID=A0A8N4F597_ELAGV|nr:transmembrane protein 234 homolog isoform X2 [Elaeis guineensis]
MGADVEKMIGVGLVWGATNAVMRRGALIWDQKRSAAPPDGRRGLLGPVRQWLDLLLTWQYSVPFIINLSASGAFFYILGGAPISVAVPVTNATTFAATAVVAMLLGEEMRVGHALFEHSCILFVLSKENSKKG